MHGRLVQSCAAVSFNHARQPNAFRSDSLVYCGQPCPAMRVQAFQVLGSGLSARRMYARASVRSGDRGSPRRLVSPRLAALYPRLECSAPHSITISPRSPCRHGGPENLVMKHASLLWSQHVILNVNVGTMSMGEYLNISACISTKMSEFANVHARARSRECGYECSGA